MTAWLAATRPKTLPAALAPVAVGLALAATVQPVDWLRGAACLAVGLLIQIATNFFNDAIDAQRGTDNAQRIGPQRAVASGQISASAMLRAATLVCLAALAIGLWLSLIGGWPILLLGLVSLLCAWAYTGGPLPLAYLGLGDPFVLIFFGLVATLGTAWLQIADAPGCLAGIWPRALGMPTWWWLCALAIGCQATAILVVNNIRDRHGDAASGKLTLAVRFGLRANRLYYAALHGAACAALMGAARIGHDEALHIPMAIAGLGGSMVAFGVACRDGAALNPLLGGSAALELLTAASIVLALHA